MSAAMGILNIYAGIGAGLTTIIGKMTKNVLDSTSKVSLRVLTGIIAGGTEAFYDFISYLINKFNK